MKIELSASIATNAIGNPMNTEQKQPFNPSSPTRLNRAIEEREADPVSSIGEISHELRTPLTSIQGALGLLLSGKVDLQTREGQQLLRIAANNTKRLLRLTNAIEQDEVGSASLISQEALDRLRLEADLQAAWEKKEFQVFYQPIVCLRSDRILGFEALLRWFHQGRGFISPAEFIPIAEETLLIHDLGLWVLESACEQLRQWQQDFPQPKPLTCSVNLSALQLLHPNCVESIRQIYQASGVIPGTLTVEITESMFIENSPVAIAALQELKALNIPIYLDDFGTGYSSLARLQQLSVDVLKIDRAFVTREQWEMIRGILYLAESLGLDTIVEGIETQEELKQVQNIGCTKVQGFWFARPLAEEGATALLQENSKS
jgi:EAL domain-containing protein (putative c-di-GMP-specific phosphodiesterase class I)